MKRLFAAHLGLVAALTLAMLAPVKGFAKKKTKKEKDPEAIGDRDVGKGINFYSLEKEIALGKQVAQEIERQARDHRRSGNRRVRQPRRSEPGPQFGCESSGHDQGARRRGSERYGAARRLLLRELRADSESRDRSGTGGRDGARDRAHRGRHGTRQATRGQVVNLASIPLIFMGGWTGYGIRQATSVLVPIGFLKFSRGFESEADLLGLQYLYKAGYDPTAFVDFFEKIQSAEKKKPGTMSKVFSSHPMTDDRIKNSQKNIQEILEAKPEYVVTHSEFNDVKARLASLQNRRKVDDKDDNRPTSADPGRQHDADRRRQGQQEGQRGRKADSEAPHGIVSPSSTRKGPGGVSTRPFSFWPRERSQIAQQSFPLSVSKLTHSSNSRA